MPMTFRNERLVSGENAIVLRVCGRVQIERVNTIKELIEEETAKLALDLSEVTLANRDVATFLAVCELKGIELRNCPAFLRGLGCQKNRRALRCSFAEAAPSSGARHVAIARDHLKRETHTKGRTPVTDTYKALEVLLDLASPTCIRVPRFRTGPAKKNFRVGPHIMSSLRIQMSYRASCKA
jgi:hypothetical protein